VREVAVRLRAGAGAILDDATGVVAHQCPGATLTDDGGGGGATGFQVGHANLGVVPIGREFERRWNTQLKALEQVKREAEQTLQAPTLLSAEELEAPCAGHRANNRGQGYGGDDSYVVGGLSFITKHPSGVQTFIDYRSLFRHEDLSDYALRAGVRVEF
jgi:hypothetical protein